MKKMFTKKTISVMLAGIGVLVIFIGALLIWRYYSAHYAIVKKSEVINQATTTPASSIEAGKKASQALVNEVKNDVGGQGVGSLSQVVTVTRMVDGKPVSEEAVTVARGTSPISTKTGEVLNKNGEVAQNSSTQGTPAAPTQSLYYVDPNKLPQNSVKIAINQDNTVVPNTFTVHPGQAVSLAIINNTPSLSALTFSLLPKTTQAITFNAPNTLGEYVFASNVSSQRDNGMVGKMIVQ